MKKILCLSDRLGFRGGAERQLSGLAYFLSQKGYSVQVATYLPQNYPSVLEMDYGMRYYYIPNSGSTLSKLLAVFKFIRREKFDIVIAYKEGPVNICGILKCLGLKFKLIASDRNTDQGINRLVRRKIFFYSYADYVVPNSYSQGDFIKKNFSKLSSKTKTIINYIDASRFIPIEYKIEMGPLKCIVVASIKEQKNPLNFIEAIDILKNRGIKVQVDWYGHINDEDLYEACKNKIATLKLDEYISILPAVTNIHELYPKYELACLPSFFEGFPNALCEAMSCGLPVLASNVCDNPYILKQGRYGILFNPSQPLEIANAFIDYINNHRNRRNVIREENRERILTLCSTEAFTQNYVTLIEA